MRRSRADAERTRRSILDSALTLFAQEGVRATSFEQIALKAGVTRGAVYWYFPDKPALVKEMLDGLSWPLDIGTDLSAYGSTPHSMQLLRGTLWQRMKQCIDNPHEWQVMQFLLRHGGIADLPGELAQSVALKSAIAVQQIEQVVTLAQARGELRAGLTPFQVAHSLHAVGMGVLAEHARAVIYTDSSASSLPLMLVMLGACTDTRMAAEFAR